MFHLILKFLNVFLHCSYPYISLLIPTSNTGYFHPRFLTKSFVLKLIFFDKEKILWFTKKMHNIFFCSWLTVSIPCTDFEWLYWNLQTYELGTQRSDVWMVHDSNILALSEINQKTFVNYNINICNLSS